ncbi:MAG: hypothetical protein LAO20_16165 [Acidobacteriia bacterium]|nr:hypothetical protein [Terriglobia bacterium]
MIAGIGKNSTTEDAEEHGGWKEDIGKSRTDVANPGWEKTVRKRSLKTEQGNWSG